MRLEVRGGLWIVYCADADARGFDRVDDVRNVVTALAGGGRKGV